MCSVSASIATLAFYQNLFRRVQEYKAGISPEEEQKENNDIYIKTLMRKLATGALFDSRCFNIPKEEVANLLYWRQLDARRNSILMVGQAYFSAKTAS